MKTDDSKWFVYNLVAVLTTGDEVRHVIVGIYEGMQFPLREKDGLDRGDGDDEMRFLPDGWDKLGDEYRELVLVVKL